MLLCKNRCEVFCFMCKFVKEKNALQKSLFHQNSKRGLFCYLRISSQIMETCLLLTKITYGLLKYVCVLLSNYSYFEKCSCILYNIKKKFPLTVGPTTFDFGFYSNKHAKNINWYLYPKFTTLIHQRLFEFLHCNMICKCTHFMSLPIFYSTFRCVKESKKTHNRNLILIIM